MTSVEADISSLDGFEQSHPPSKPLDELPSFEELFAMTRVEELKPATLTVLEARFSPQEVEEAMIGFDLMADLHRGRRRRSGAEEGTHPAFVGLWHVLVNPDATVDQYVTALLHDVIEDCGQNEKSVHTQLTERAYPKLRAPRIARGVEGLSRDDPNDQIEYLHKMSRISSEVDELTIIEIKALDTAHTDLHFTDEVKRGKVDPETAREYLRKKASLVEIHAQTYAPHARNTQILRGTVIGLNNELALRGQRDQAARRSVTARMLV